MSSQATRVAVAALVILVAVAAAGAAPPAARPAAAGATAASSRSPAVPLQDDAFDFGRLGRIAVYRPSGAPTGVALFLSGDGGWGLGVVDMARALARRGALVAGVDMRHLYRTLGASSEGCSYPAADFEALAHTLEARYHLTSYHYPVLVGYSSGATLAYALLLQAPAGTFAGALSLGFCPDLEFRTPLCERGLLRAERRTRPPPGFDLLPVARVPAPWIALQGEIDQVCNASATTAFVGEVAGARIVLLPKVGHGYSVPRHWEPQYLGAYTELDAAAQRVSHPAAVAALEDLPVVEVPATAGSGDSLAVLLTGDGGWSGLDRDVAGALAARGVPVVGLSTLQYFWRAKSPQRTADDVARILRHYLATWHKSRVLLLGYSMGADVLPFVVNRLPPDTLARVAGATMIAPGNTAAFEFHFTNWLGGGGDGLPLAPEIGRLPVPLTCIYGDDDHDTVCRSLAGARQRVLALPGGHHFGGDYERVADAVLAGLADQSL